MTIARISNNESFSFQLSVIMPFIYIGYLPKYSFADTWGSDIDGVVLQTGEKVDVISVYEKYLNQLDSQESYNDCIAQESSYYFDSVNQVVYIHVSHDANPIYDDISYGYAIGLSMDEVVHINGYPFLPLVKTMPSASREASIFGSESPTKSTASIVLVNGEMPDPVTGDAVGILDYLLTEKIYGNVLQVSDYDESTGNEVPVSSWNIGNTTISESEIVIELEDRRYK